MWKKIRVRHATIFGLLTIAIVFGFLHYNKKKSLARNLERVAFAINVDKLPVSLQVESAYVDNWTEYHIVIACRDDTRRLDYTLAGRDWKITEASPPWDYTSLKDNKGLGFTIVREAKWDVEDNVSASVLFDQDGQRFIANKPRHPTASSRSDSLIFRNYNPAILMFPASSGFPYGWWD